MVNLHTKTIRRSNIDIIFDVCNMLFMLLFLFIMLYPMYFTVIASLSDINEVGKGNVYLLPKGLSFEAYKNVLSNPQIWSGYTNSIIYTLGGTLYGIFIMLPTAYSLSKKQLYGRKVITWYFLVTMYFSGGMVPAYLLVRNLGLLNTPLVMIVGSMSIYNMVVTRTFFSTSIPVELYESANIDGASEITSFFRIALPVAKPIIAVMALFISVSIWNSYFGALIYITDSKLFPLQIVLRNILIMNQQMISNQDIVSQLSSEDQIALAMKANLAQSIKYSVIFIASAPLLAMYPFIQKYFVKGIMIGSLKG